MGGRGDVVGRVWGEGGEGEGRRGHGLEAKARGWSKEELPPPGGRAATRPYTAHPQASIAFTTTQFQCIFTTTNL